MPRHLTDAQKCEIFALTPLVATSHPGEYSLTVHTDPLGTAPVQVSVTREAAGVSLSLSLLGDRVAQAIPHQDAGDPQRLRCAVQVMIARYLSSAAYETRLRELASDIDWDWREAA